MKDWILSDFEQVVFVAVSTVGVFTLLILFVRISGLRSFAKMSIIDFASTIAIGSVLASTLLNKSPSMIVGGLAVGFILLYQTIFSRLVIRFELMNRLLTNKPVVLMSGERIHHDVLRKVNMSEGDLMAKLREANVLQISEVKCVVLESTGDVSVLHSSGDEKVEDAVLTGVRRPVS
ncbi:MAG: DUF421 domain-containing protein [Verrucomicrobiales bacterium]|nr:DUF421 domain-containing protein [Verrucomicrobiales bacterium]